MKIILSGDEATEYINLQNKVTQLSSEVIALRLAKQTAEKPKQPADAPLGAAIDAMNSTNSKLSKAKGSPYQMKQYVGKLVSYIAKMEGISEMGVRTRIAKSGYCVRNKRMAVKAK